MMPSDVAMPELEQETRTFLLPRHALILENDPHHSMGFVVDVLMKLFKFSAEKAVERMLEAHQEGESVIWTGSKEGGEFRLEQIMTFHEKHADGRDLGPLGCRLEPID